MSSGPSVNIVTGISSNQLEIEQFESELIAEKNEKRIENELETDFFVGPNGKVLPKKFEKWIGSNKRESLLKHAKNEKVRNVINQLYRPGSFIGDGGTASIIKFEKETGIGLGRKGNTHMQKGREMVKYINSKILVRDDLSAGDRKMLEKLMKSLTKAIWS